MEKLIFFVERKAGLSRQAFQQRFLGSHAALVLEHFATLRGLVLNLNARAEDRFDPIDPLTKADAVAEMWFATHDDFADLSRRYASAEGRAALDADWREIAGKAHGYRTSERVQRAHEGAPAPGEPSPGSKLIAGLRRAPALSHEQFLDHWLHTHVPLALRHVLGMGAYVTNEVTAPITPGSPDLDGIVEVLYTGKREFDSPEGESIMRADTAKFLQPPSPMRLREYVLRSPFP
jgi:hypothetical protein